jgi:hypothetical protein
MLFEMTEEIAIGGTHNASRTLTLIGNTHGASLQTAIFALDSPPPRGREPRPKFARDAPTPLRQCFQQRRIELVRFSTGEIPTVFLQNRFAIDPISFVMSRKLLPQMLHISNLEVVFLTKTQIAIRFNITEQTCRPAWAGRGLVGPPEMRCER